MTLDLNDPASVVAWYRINPERHAEFLRYCLSSERWSQFWTAIKASRERLKP